MVNEGAIVRIGVAGRFLHRSEAFAGALEVGMVETGSATEESASLYAEQSVLGPGLRPVIGGRAGASVEGRHSALTEEYTTP